MPLMNFGGGGLGGLGGLMGGKGMPVPDLARLFGQGGYPMGNDMRRPPPQPGQMVNDVRPPAVPYIGLDGVPVYPDGAGAGTGGQSAVPYIGLDGQPVYPNGAGAGAGGQPALQYLGPDGQPLQQDPMLAGQTWAGARSPWDDFTGLGSLMGIPGGQPAQQGRSFEPDWMSDGAALDRRLAELRSNPNMAQQMGQQWASVLGSPGGQPTPKRAASGWGGGWGGF